MNKEPRRTRFVLFGLVWFGLVWFSLLWLLRDGRKRTGMEEDDPSTSGPDDWNVFGGGWGKQKQPLHFTSLPNQRIYVCMYVGMYHPDREGLVVPSSPTHHEMIGR